VTRRSSFGWRRRAAVMSSVGVLALAAAGVLPFARGAGAYTAPPATATMSVTPTSGGPGTVINVKSVTPCPAGGQNAIIGFTPNTLWGGTKVSTNVSNNGQAWADGSWTASFTVPSTVNVPSFQISAECWTLNGLVVTNWLTYFSTTFTVTSGGAPPPPPPPPPPSGTCRSSGASTPVGAAATATGRGLWMADFAGNVLRVGDATCQGSLAGTHLAQPIVGSRWTSEDSVTVTSGTALCPTRANAAFTSRSRCPSPLASRWRFAGAHRSNIRCRRWAARAALSGRAPRAMDVPHEVAQRGLGRSTVVNVGHRKNEG